MQREPYLVFVMQQNTVTGGLSLFIRSGLKGLSAAQHMHNTTLYRYEGLRVLIHVNTPPTEPLHCRLRRGAIRPQLQFALDREDYQSMRQSTVSHRGLQILPSLDSANRDIGILVKIRTRVILQCRPATITSSSHQKNNLNSTVNNSPTRH
jgi:hypothetical protein